MKHIVTKSEIETKARADYAYAKPAVMTADKKLGDKVAELLALRHKMDEDELRKSQLMGEIMCAMKTATILKNEDGAVIVTWKEAVEKATVDYKGLCKKYKVSSKDYNAYTTTKLGARTFELIEEQSECKDMNIDTLEQMKV